MLRPVQEIVREAVEAAASVRSQAVAMRGAEGATVRSLVSYVNGLQAAFERVAPIGALTADEVQGAVVALYGSRAPASALALLGAAQATGGAVIAAVVVDVLGPAPVSWSWDADANVYRERALAGADLAPMHAALDALILALAPVGG